MPGRAVEQKGSKAQLCRASPALLCAHTSVVLPSACFLLLMERGRREKYNQGSGTACEHRVCDLFFLSFSIRHLDFCSSQ